MTTPPKRRARRSSGVELSARTREWVGRLRGAHDDPAVSAGAFVALLYEWTEYLDTCPERERREAAFRLASHVAGAHVVEMGEL